MERLLYRSEATEGVTTSDVMDIIAASERNNPKREITGFLVVEGDRFLQMLEGPPLAVEALVADIERDPRNTNLEVLVRATATERWFPDWAMKRLISFGSIPAEIELRETLGVRDGSRLVLAEVEKFFAS